MSKFKIGDKVALARIPRDYLGCIEQIYGERAVIKSKDIDEFHIDLDCLVLYDETDMDIDDIYDMLKPRMDKVNVLKYGYYYCDHTMFNADETIKAIALAYRSGYLRVKKGEPFKIGGEKK